MPEDAVLREAELWWKKLSDPNCGTYKIIHARMAEVEEGGTFDPEAVLERYRATGGERIKKLAEALQS